MKRPRWLSLCILSGAIATAAGQVTDYGIGEPASPEEIRARDISVAPDGAGLPAGSGTVSRGQHLYENLCSSCHGARGEGVGSYPALAGGQGTLTSNDPKKTVGSYWPYATTVWDYIRRKMPYQTPGTLSPDETYALTAWVLYLNGIVKKNATLDAKTLPRVKMPNRDGFVPDPRPDVRVKRAGCAC